MPYIRFTQTECQQLQTYTSTGGTLIVLDDYGYGNQVLAGVESSIKFTGQPLLDPLFDYHNKRLPKITDFTTTALSSNVSSIVFNHASSLEVGSGATVAAQSSSFSFLDTNNNGVQDENETVGAQPVVAYQKIGQGYVVAVADPSLLINGMVNLDDNLQFIKNAAALGASNPQIYLDQTHLPKTPLDGAKAALAAVYGAASSPLGATGVVAAVIVVTFYQFKKSEKYDKNNS